MEVISLPEDYQNGFTATLNFPKIEVVMNLLNRCCCCCLCCFYTCQKCKTGLVLIRIDPSPKWTPKIQIGQNKLEFKTYTSTRKNTFTLVILQSFSISGIISAENVS